jgi:hypothetical protein
MIGLALALMFVAGPCECPQVAASRDLVLATEAPASHGGGFVVCGYTRERQAEVVVASEFEIFSCGGDKPMLTFGATKTALLRATPIGLEVTEVSNWPFGNEWRWVEVPIYRWELPYGKTAAPERTVVLTPPKIPTEQLDALFRWYGDLARQSAEVRRAAQSEEAVGRLFAAALTDEDRFRSIFKEMREALSLDGHSAEVYSEAEAMLASYADARGKRHLKN